MYLRRLWLGLGALLLSIVAPVAAHAQSTPCASWSPSNVDISAQYNPFSPSTVAGNVTMTFNEGILKPIAIFVYLHPHDSSEASATVTDTTNGNFSLVVPTGTDPNPGPGSPAGDKLSFSPSNPTAPSIANWAFSIPASAFSSTAGVHTVSFDMEIGCKGTSDSRDISTVLNGLTFSYTVPAELQASFAGTSLPLGDVTNDLSGQAAISGQIDVKSTGAYTVAVSSPNGFLLEPGGSGASGASQEIGYKLTYLGQSAAGVAGGVSTTWPNLTCASASSTGVQQQITATLNENVKGANPGKVSGSYKDTISVTFTPLITPPGGTLPACNS